MKQKIKQFITQKEYRNIYIIIGLIILGSYYFIRNMMIDQSAWSTVKTGGITINMLLLMFLWGVYAERKWKKEKPMKRLLLDFAGLVVIILVFKFAFGLETPFG